MKSKHLFFTLILMLLLSITGFGQTTLDSDALNGAVDDEDTRILVDDASTFEAGRIAVVDAEAMLVLEAETSDGEWLDVRRGALGTQAVAHADNATIFVDDPEAFTSIERSGTCTAGEEFPNFEPLIALPSANRYQCFNSKWTKTHTAGKSNTVSVSKSYGTTVADHVSTGFFVADRDYHVHAIEAFWTTAESTGAMDVQVQRLQGTEAIASGDDLLSAVIDATGIAETVTSGTLVTTSATLDILDGNRLGVELTVTPNEIVGLVVTVTLFPID